MVLIGTEMAYAFNSIEDAETLLLSALTTVFNYKEAKITEYTDDHHPKISRQDPLNPLQTKDFKYNEIIIRKWGSETFMFVAVLDDEGGIFHDELVLARWMNLHASLTERDFGIY